MLLDKYIVPWWRTKDFWGPVGIGKWWEKGWNKSVAGYTSAPHCAALSVCVWLNVYRLFLYNKTLKAVCSVPPPPSSCRCCERGYGTKESTIDPVTHPFQPCFYLVWEDKLTMKRQAGWTNGRTTAMATKYNNRQGCDAASSSLLAGVPYSDEIYGIFEWIAETVLFVLVDVYIQEEGGGWMGGEGSDRLGRSTFSFHQPFWEWRNSRKCTFSMKRFSFFFFSWFCRVTVGNNETKKALKEHQQRRRRRRRFSVTIWLSTDIGLSLSPLHSRGSSSSSFSSCSRAHETAQPKHSNFFLEQPP